MVVMKDRFLFQLIHLNGESKLGLETKKGKRPFYRACLLAPSAGLEPATL